MKKITLIFNLHQPFRLKRYRFFDIGNDHYYYDDFENEEIIRRNNKQTYAPANEALLQLMEHNPDFKVSFVISGTMIEQLETFAPETINTFKLLAETGRTDFLCTLYCIAFRQERVRIPNASALSQCNFPFWYYALRGMQYGVAL